MNVQNPSVTTSKIHLLILDRLLSAGRLEDGRRYLSRLAASAAGTSFSSCTGNPVVDLLLSEKIHQAQQQSIRVTAGGNLPAGPEDFDLCVMHSITLCTPAGKYRAQGE